MPVATRSAKKRQIKLEPKTGGGEETQVEQAQAIKTPIKLFKDEEMIDVQVQSSSKKQKQKQSNAKTKELKEEECEGGVAGVNANSGGASANGSNEGEMKDVTMEDVSSESNAAPTPSTTPTSASPSTKVVNDVPEQEKISVGTSKPKKEEKPLSSSSPVSTSAAATGSTNLFTITPDSNINIDPVATPPSTPSPPLSKSSKRRRKKRKSKSSSSSTSPLSSPLPSRSPSKLPSQPGSGSQLPPIKKTKKSKLSKPAPTPIINPQIAVQVHRFRNANYIPRAILKLCATPLFLPSVSASTSNNMSKSSSNIVVAPHLAISREGGSVELVSVDEKWKCVAVVEGMKNRNVDAMAWICDSKPFSSGSASNSAPTLTSSEDLENKTNSSNSNYIDRHNEQVEKAQLQRRLFGASRDGTIFEIDFKSKRHVGVIGSGGGAVFCLTSLYGRGGSYSEASASVNASAQFCNLIAAGCEDGSVRIFQAQATDSKSRANNVSAPSLELVSTLPSVGNAITSIAWLPPPTGRSKSGTPSLEGSVLFAGVADGTIRKFVVSSVLQSNRTTGSVPHAMSTGMVLATSTIDSEANTAIATMTAENGTMLPSPSSVLTGLQWKASARLTVENRGRRKATKIWALKVLDDGTLISCDSMGNIQFWDSTAGTLLQSFEHNRSNADVLDLAVSYDQRKVMASGIDSRVVCIELNTEYSPGVTARTPTSTSTPNKWILSTQQRHHTHDVHSLAIVYMTKQLGCPRDKLTTPPYKELLCSGGIDTKVSSYSVSSMRKYRPKVAYKYPSNAPVVLSRKPRVMSIMRPDRVDFYQLGGKRPAPYTVGSGVALDEERAHLGSVRISSNYNLMSFDINDDGTLLAVSHAGGTLLFSIEFLDSYEKGDRKSRKIVKPSKIEVPSVVNTPYSSLKFSKNDPSLLVCAHCNGTINSVRIKEGPDDHNFCVSLEHTFDEYSIKSNFSNIYPITHLDISPDGRWLAAGRNTIGRGSVQIFSLSPSYNHWWTLPCTEAPLSSMRWLGDGDTDPALATALNNGAFYLFDVEQRCLSEWSQDLGFPASPNLPRELTRCTERPDRIAFNSATPNKFIMGGQTWFCSIDLDAPVPQQSRPYPSDHFKAKNWGKMILHERSKSSSALHEKSLTPRKWQKSVDNKAETVNSNFTICLRYSGIIFLDFLDKNEMVVVEQPWLGIVNALPDALERQRYGS